MKVSSVPHLALHALLGDKFLVRDAGCSWYATEDRRSAGVISLDADSEKFYFRVFRSGTGKWVVTKPADRYETFKQAESALLAAMNQGKAEISVSEDVEPRLRFGKRPVRPSDGSA